MFTRTSPSPQPCSPFGRGEGVVSIWCGYQDAPITRGFSETALTLNHFFETFRAPGPSGFAYENIAISEINSPDRNRFIAGKRLCVSRAGGLSAATTSSHAATASSHSTTASSHAASTSSRGRRGSRGRGSATGADCGNGHGLSRSGFYLDWRMLGLERSLGVGTRPLGPPAASGRRLDAAPLRISQWCACLHPRRLEIVFPAQFSHTFQRGGANDAIRAGMGFSFNALRRINYTASQRTDRPMAGAVSRCFTRDVTLIYSGASMD